MYLFQSEQCDNDTKKINFNEILYSRQKQEWKDLEFHALEKRLVLYKFDSLININEQKIFDLWKHDFDINRSAHICNNLDFHYIYKGKCISFLLKMKNCCMTMRKGNYLARIEYLERF